MVTNLSALYLSLKRLSEILPSQAFLYAGNAAQISVVRTDNMQRLRLMTTLETEMINWLNVSTIPTLGELMVTNSIAAGSFFTHYGAFQGKGILAATNAHANGKPIVAETRIRADLDDLVSGASLKAQVHPENFTCASAPGELSGKKRLFLVGRITDANLPDMEAQAYLIGHLHTQYRPPEDLRETSGRTIADPFGRLPFQMEVYLSNVSPFCEAANEPMARPNELIKLEGILESEVKSAFAEILGEPFVPKDSPSETSDLQTTQLLLDGHQLSAAFAFKGRGLPRPLTVANASKHGDQISKLFSEPTELVVFQHCSKVTSHFRAHMRAFATRLDRLRPFMIIDGNDTVRILRHFRKLGFS